MRLREALQPMLSRAAELVNGRAEPLKGAVELLKGEAEAFKDRADRFLRRTRRLSKQRAIVALKVCHRQHHLRAVDGQPGRSPHPHSFRRADRREVAFGT
jgi:hypothetical protein